jgi:DNA modification methylase
MNKIINSDCLIGLKKIEDNSIDCCVTSPPYLGLRDYGTDEQIGLEETPELFIEKLVAVFDEVKRVLKPEGTLWVNMGDSYAAGPRNRTIEQATRNSGLNGGLMSQAQSLKQPNKITGKLKAKDLIGIPWMLAFALRSKGWYLRQDIIWHKPNPMPESVTDRCTKSHEYIFLLSKSQKYYYDNEAIQELANYDGRKDMVMKGSAKYANDYAPSTTNTQSIAINGHQRWKNNEAGEMIRNKRSVWTVTTKPFKDAHFATFPEDLIVDCIKAGCPENGIVLDPFMGAGTTALVARKLNRNYIGFELNREYIKIAEKRLSEELGMFL